MRSTFVMCGVVLAAVGVCCGGDAGGADAPSPRHRPIVAGSVTLNANDIVAVYRPVDLQSVAIYVGRPGHGIQAIVIRDSKEAAAVFSEIASNAEVTKDPGDDDARPLTRLRPKDSQKSPTVIANVDRVMAVVWDRERRHARVYLDKLVAGEILVDPNGRGDGSEFLEVENIRGEADELIAAYKACVLRK
jgi:hypothetical protein